MRQHPQSLSRLERRAASLKHCFLYSILFSAVRLGGETGSFAILTRKTVGSDTIVRRGDSSIIPSSSSSEPLGPLELSRARGCFRGRRRDLSALRIGAGPAHVSSSPSSSESKRIELRSCCGVGFGAGFGAGGLCSGAGGVGFGGGFGAGGLCFGVGGVGFGAPGAGGGRGLGRRRRQL